MGILKSSSSISSVWEYWNHHHLYLHMGILKYHHLYIQYRNTESPSSVSIFRLKGPNISFQSHMASQLSRAICYVFCFSRAKRNTRLFLAKPRTHSRPQIKASTWCAFLVWDTTILICICIAIQSIVMVYIIV